MSELWKQCHIYASNNKVKKVKYTDGLISEKYVGDSHKILAFTNSTGKKMPVTFFSALAEQFFLKPCTSKIKMSTKTSTGPSEGGITS